MFAVQYNFSDASISALIELGSDVNAADESGMTCLHHSVYCSDDDATTFKLLLSKGANPDIKDEDGETGRSLANENPAYKSAFEIVDG